LFILYKEVIITDSVVAKKYVSFFVFEEGAYLGRHSNVDVVGFLVMGLNFGRDIIIFVPKINSNSSAGCLNFCTHIMIFISCFPYLTKFYYSALFLKFAQKIRCV
jgi:hypothetical protein